MIETHFWEQLAAIAELGTFSAASDRLHLTQPALSRSMKKLEELLEVSLFERGKNKIALNDTGKLAADCAARILKQEADMIEKIRTHYQASRTLKIGSCAPVPLRELVPRLTEGCPGQTVSSEMSKEDVLLKKLHNGALQMAVLNRPVQDPGLCCRRLMEEQMYFSVAKTNPLADQNQVSMSDINGQTILLYSNIGFWYDLCRRKLPRSRFLLQTEFDVFREVAVASELPFFVSDWHIRHGHFPEDRVYLPISDPEAKVTYYIICRKGEIGQLKALLHLA